MCDIRRFSSISISIFTVLIFTTSAGALERSLIFRESPDDVVEKLSDETSINWTAGFIQAQATVDLPEIVFDINHPDYNLPNTVHTITEARDWAHAAAYEKAEHKLNYLLGQIVLNSNLNIAEKIELKHSFRERMGDIRDRFQIRNRRTGEGKVSVDLALPFRTEKGLYAVLAGQNYSLEEAPRMKSEVEDEITGVIISLEEFSDFQAALEPQILTDRGLRVYGPEIVNKSCAINRGVVRYFSTNEQAYRSPVVGKKPYYLLASGISGKNNSTIYINSEDSAQLLSSGSAREALKNCSVAIVIGKRK